MYFTHNGQTSFDPEHGEHVTVTPRYKIGPALNDTIDAEPWVGVMHVGPGYRKLIGEDGEMLAEIRCVACTVHGAKSAEVVGLVDGCVEGSWVVEPFVRLALR